MIEIGKALPNLADPTATIGAAAGAETWLVKMLHPFAGDHAIPRGMDQAMPHDEGVALTPWVRRAITILP
ncbi:hypothetical protein [Bradyrhizobium sp. CCBAU 53421]|uniref:hypothetical protein n=1 Tax=Bradyrhizobium sp. CCBAU 53421 TaxID=1325120 RepID=UPI00188ABE3D|nr:hypothetical protein [Bradyrhizobium sp. CCBAU 53421]